MNIKGTLCLSIRYLKEMVLLFMFRGCVCVCVCVCVSRVCPLLPPEQLLVQWGGLPLLLLLSPLTDLQLPPAMLQDPLELRLLLHHRAPANHTGQSATPTP